MLLLKIACAVFVAIIAIALFQYHQERLQEHRHKISMRIAEAIEAGNAGHHYEACQRYNEMLNEGLLIDDWSDEILKRECLKTL